MARAFDSVAPASGSYCSSCDGPVPGQYRVTVLRDAERLGACEDCSRPTDSSGRCVAGSSGGTYVIRLVRLPAGRAPGRGGAAR